MNAKFRRGDINMIRHSLRAGLLGTAAMALCAPALAFQDAS